MKEYYRAALKRTLCTWMGTTRLSLNMTQDRMAEILLIDVRSYADLDRGVSMCSTLTLVLFLIYLCPEPETLLEEIKASFEIIRCKME